MYAHCLRDTPGGVALLAINTDQTAAYALTVPGGMRFTLSSARASVQARQMKLNGTTLALTGNDELPALAVERLAGGTVSLAPASITFLTLPEAGDQVCR